MTEKDLVGLQIALTPILVIWEKVCVRRRDAEPIDADMVELYAKSLSEIEITPEELENARRALLLETKYFPAIAEISEWVLAHRDNRYRGWMCCEDADGFPFAAPPHKVHNGLYVPEGGGNGLPKPKSRALDFDRSRVDRLLSARDVRRPVALGMPGASRILITPEQEKGLIEEARNRARDRYLTQSETSGRTSGTTKPEIPAQSRTGEGS